MTPLLQTDRLTLRPPTGSDGGHFVDYYTGPRRAAAGGPRTAEQAHAGFDALMAHWGEKGYGRFIVEDGQSVIGLVGPHRPQGYPEGEIAWQIWLDEAEGKGLAYEAAVATRAFAYGSLGWDTAVSYIADDNLRSQNLARRMGAELDPDATKLDAPEPHAVYRHPKPGARQ